MQGFLQMFANFGTWNPTRSKDCQSNISWNPSCLSLDSHSLNAALPKSDSGWLPEISVEPNRSLEEVFEDDDNIFLVMAPWVSGPTGLPSCALLSWEKQPYQKQGFHLANHQSFRLAFGNQSNLAMENPWNSNWSWWFPLFSHQSSPIFINIGNSSELIIIFSQISPKRLSDLNISCGYLHFLIIFTWLAIVDFEDHL